MKQFKTKLITFITLCFVCLITVGLWLGYCNVFHVSSLDINNVSYDEYEHTYKYVFVNNQRVHDLTITIDDIVESGKSIDITEATIVVEGEIYDASSVALSVGENNISFEFGKYFERKGYLLIKLADEVELDFNEIIINANASISPKVKLAGCFGLIVAWLVVYCLVIFLSKNTLFDSFETVIHNKVIEPIRHSNTLKAACKFAVKTFTIYVIGIVTIIRANVAYIDDLGRIDTGKLYDFDTYSRFFGAKIINFFNAYDAIFDSSPMGQIMSMFMMAIAFTIILWAIAPNELDNNWMLLASIQFALSPFFMENISFKVEGIIHGASVLLAVLPILFYKKRNWLYCLITIICTVLMCETYTAATAVYPIVVVFIVAKEWNEGEDLKTYLRLLLTSVLSYGIGLGIFQKFIMVPIETHVTSEMPPLVELPASIARNLTDLYANIYYDFKLTWIGMIIMIVGFFLIVFARKSVKNNSMAILVGTITVLFMGVFCFGIYILLETVQINPRSMYGFTMVVSLFCIYLIENGKIVTKIPIVALSWMFIIFCLNYGNCLAIQQDYADVRMQAVINYLNENCNEDKEYTFVLSGNIGYSPVLENKFNACAMLKVITPSMLGENWAWSQYRIYEYYGLPSNIKVQWTNTYIGDKLPEKVDSTMWFDVYSDGNVIVVDVDK